MTARRSEKPTLMQAWADTLARRTRPPFAGTPEARGGRPIDRGIERFVRVLWEMGVDTTQSCQGGSGHSYPEPTVCFEGGQAEGPYALGIALRHGLKPIELRRVWSIRDGEATGPHWQLVFGARDIEALGGGQQ